LALPSKMGENVFDIFLMECEKSSLFESSSGNHNHFLSSYFRNEEGGGLKFFIFDRKHRSLLTPN